MNSRRDFLKTGTLATLGLSLPFTNNSILAATAYKKLPAFGIQLWTVGDDMRKDAKDTLKKLSTYGYTQIESFEGANGSMFWGLGNKGFKQYLSDLGMTIVSSHCNMHKDFETKAALAGEIGMKYLICPSIGAQKSVDDSKKIAEKFNKAGEICKKNGLRFAYHNHAYSFTPVDGQIPQDVMMQETDTSLVDFEMDIYWVTAAGQDPIKWFEKYPGRFRLCHIKDYSKIEKGKGYESVDLGKGTINFKEVLRIGAKNGLSYYLVEQEAFTGSTPMQSADMDARYMKGLKI